MQISHAHSHVIGWDQQLSPTEGHSR